MTKHVHAEMIKTKADNMELVVFVKNDEWDLTESCNDALMFFAGKDYFLCLPQHKEACLHWLNGGDVLVKSKSVTSWEVVSHGQVWAILLDGCARMRNTASNHARKSST